MDGVINGFSEMSPSLKKGLKDIVDSPLIRGLWTWSRGGGWWGPYIHGHELWYEKMPLITSFVLVIITPPTNPSVKVMAMKNEST